MACLASTASCFNHESPRRGETFVTRKVTRAATRIKLGLQDKLFMGNLDAMRDWGFAGDYVEGMWLMLQQEKPEDFVIATGETHSVKEWIEECASACWALTGRSMSRPTRVYARPAEVDLLLGDASKAKKVLQWEPKVKVQGVGQDDDRQRPESLPSARRSFGIMTRKRFDLAVTDSVSGLACHLSCTTHKVSPL